MIEGEVTESDVKAFAAGVTLDDGYETKPGKLTILESAPQSEIELVITEGKFHQVNDGHATACDEGLIDGQRPVHGECEVLQQPGELAEVIDCEVITLLIEVDPGLLQ